MNIFINNSFYFDKLIFDIYYIYKIPKYFLNILNLNFTILSTLKAFIVYNIYIFDIEIYTAI